MSKRGRRLLVATQAVETGVPIHILELLDGLAGTSVEIDAVCPKGSLLWRTVEGRPQVSLHPLAGARRPAASDTVDLVRLTRLASRATVIHLHSAKAGFLGRVAAALRHRADSCIFTPHGWSFWAFSGAEGALYLRLERLAARWCRSIVAVSHNERAAGLEAQVGAPGQYSVIHNGVDVHRFTRERKPVPGRLLLVGRLSRAKRPDVALRVVQAVRERFPTAELHIVGGGPEETRVRRLVEQLGIADSVRLLGRRDDVPELLAEADCLLLTSDYEGCPIAVLEAMAAAVPVVATNVGGVPELVVDSETGLLADARDVQGLADCVGLILGNPDFATRVGTAGRARATSQFSRRQMQEKTFALYRELGLDLS
jgi:glycosyltransferase involved in cell wall biosynthesis